MLHICATTSLCICIHSVVRQIPLQPCCSSELVTIRIRKSVLSYLNHAMPMLAQVSLHRPPSPLQNSADFANKVHQLIEEKIQNRTFILVMDPIASRAPCLLGQNGLSGLLLDSSILLVPANFSLPQGVQSEMQRQHVKAGC